jgi:hypothetical protein
MSDKTLESLAVLTVRPAERTTVHSHDMLIPHRFPLPGHRILLTRPDGREQTACWDQGESGGGICEFLASTTPWSPKWAGPRSGRLAVVCGAHRDDE